MRYWRPSLIGRLKAFASRNDDYSCRRLRSYAAHGMDEMPGKICAISCLEHMAAVRRSHLDGASENEKHLLAVVLLSGAAKLRAGLKQKPFHEAAYRRQQLEAIAASLIGAVASEGAADADQVLGRVLAEQLTDRHFEGRRESQHSPDRRLLGASFQAGEKSFVETGCRGKRLHCHSLLLANAPEPQPDEFRTVVRP